MTTTRRVLTGLTLTAVLLSPAAAQAVDAPKDDPTPVQPHIKAPLSGLLTRSGTPVDWSILGVRL
ncbi:hypothetical protein T261_1350 [Streptomyces lydicus]|nr:hypothetical protein T261_1350 [Streptomyces lydicus]